MKSFILLFALTVLATAIFCWYGGNSYKETDYLDKKVLDSQTPISVTIDKDLIKKLDPAYEQ